MPMQITVTRNRKTSENYNSEGHGISISVELDQSLLTKPAELQEKVGYLYAEAEAALEQQANGGNSAGEPRRSSAQRSNGNGNGRSSRSGGASGGGTMTASQRRAIEAICRRLGIDAVEELHHEFGLNLDDLTVREASKAIDHLKSLDQPAGRNGGGR